MKPAKTHCRIRSPRRPQLNRFPALHALAGLGLLATAAACGEQPAQDLSADMTMAGPTEDSAFVLNDTQSAATDTNADANFATNAAWSEGNTAAPPQDNSIEAASDRRADVDALYAFLASSPRSRELVAPNNVPWPSAAGYASGYDYLRADGMSEVSVDNGDNRSGVFVKLVALDAAGTTPVRHIFIPGGGRFTMENVTPGTYDVRYQILRTGSLFKTEGFAVTETASERSIVRLTLYNVPDGNMETTPIGSWEE